jgi:hypothetical protein
MQKGGDETAEEVHKFNGDFYHAFESLSIERMEKLWKHYENVVCIHPGWDLFTDRLAIRESEFRNGKIYNYKHKSKDL